MRYDRDEVLARTDLRELADEFLGPHKGRGRSATWPCPDPGHGPQSGRTPPVSVFVSAGTDRWRCHGCGAGGTAADLVMAVRGVGFAEALEVLGRRGGVASRDDRPPRPRPRPSPKTAPVEPRGVSEEVERHVAACEAYLWSDGGAPMRHWLAQRGLGEGVLRANRVGADPGPAKLARADGLPRGGPAVVLPVLDEAGRAVYLQARYLRRGEARKYANPLTSLAGPSPRVAQVRLAGPPVTGEVVLVCEGIPDALVVAQVGYRAAAVLGAAMPDERVAASLSRRFPTERLLVAFDADDRGRLGGARLLELLDGAGAAGRTSALEVPPAFGDMNGWLLMAEGSFERDLADAVGAAQRPVAQEPELGDPLRQALAKIHYDHVLVDHPAVAAGNLRQIQVSIAQWSKGVAIIRPPDAHVGARLADDLNSLAYRHLLGDRMSVRRNIAVARETVEDWAPAPAELLPADRWDGVARAVPRLEAGLDRTIDDGLGIDR